MSKQKSRKAPYPAVWVEDPSTSASTPSYESMESRPNTPALETSIPTATPSNGGNLGIFLDNRRRRLSPDANSPPLPQVPFFRVPSKLLLCSTFPKPVHVRF
jgi:hypothetical protein